jgi:hypothetical protein
LLHWLRAYEFIYKEYNVRVSPPFPISRNVCLHWANVDDWQEMHGKINWATPCEDEKPEPAAATTAEVEEPITAESEDE